MTTTAPTYNRSHALVIGINDYLKAPPLGYAVNDAKAVTKLLEEKFGFDRGNITLLVNRDASRSAIHKSFLDFAGDATHLDDRLLVFFAGHGHTERSRRGDVGYLVPYDGDPADLSTLIRWDTLTRDADLIEAKHVLFVMDACYGGLAITRALKPGSSRFLKDMLQRLARQVITAGKADEVVADLGGPRPDHSVFTGHFLDALDGAAESNGVLTANGVMAYVYQNVGSDPNSAQTPHYGYLHGDGDFIFNPPLLENLDTTESKDKDVLIPIPGADYAVLQPPSLLSRTKELLANEADRIKLHDLVVQETRAVLAVISTDTFKVQGTWSEEEFAYRISKYHDSIQSLEAVQMLLGSWGTKSHHDTLVLPAKRLGELVTIESGLSIWLGLRWYPVIVLMYSCALGSVASKQYSNLLALLHAPLPDQRQLNGGIKTLVQSVFEEFPRIRDAFKTLPGHERHYVPVSEYLFKRLQPIADDTLFLGADYERIFDRSELLIGLECAHMNGGWGPIGRFGWKHSNIRVDKSPLNELVAEAEAAGNQWGPLKSGFFSSSIDEFRRTIEDYQPRIERLGWN